MDFRTLSLYNVIPKKRLFIVFIGLLISSTIISGGGLLLFNIVKATHTYLGESDDIIVIFNQKSSTPYTSVLPLEMVEAVSSVQGVIDISPEVMAVAVANNKATYLRGIDVEKFWEFTKVKNVIGTLIRENDTSDVSIGINFAKRNNLSLGDRFVIYSTKIDSVLELRVKSIFTTGTLLDDEVIAPLWIGQFLSFGSFNYITHIRVKIDKNIITKEKLLNLITSKYKVNIQIKTPQGLKRLNGTVKIYTLTGKLVKNIELINTNNTTTYLNFGKYEFIAEINDVSSPPIKLIVDHNNTLVSIYISYVERELNIKVINDENEPIKDVEVRIKNIAQEAIASKELVLYTNATGYVSTTVPNGTYKITAIYGIYGKRIIYTTSEENNIEIILIQRHPQIAVISPLNNSMVIGPKIKLLATVSTGYWLYYYIDDDPSKLKLYSSPSSSYFENKGVLLKLPDGSHSITLIAYNSDYTGNKSENYGEVKILFNVISNIPEYISFENAMNNSQIKLNSDLLLNKSITFGQDLYYAWDNDELSIITDYKIPVPSYEGIHKLTLATIIESTLTKWTYIFIVTSSPSNVEIINLSCHKKVKSGDLLEIWYDKNAEQVTYMWDNEDPPKILKGSTIVVPALEDGKHFLTISLLKGSSWLNKTFELYIDNTPPQIYLSEINGTTLSPESIVRVSANESLSKILIAWDGIQSYSQIYDNIIPLPLVTGTHVLKIKVYDQCENYNETTFVFNIVNGSAKTTFFLEKEYSGIVNESYIELTILSQQDFEKAFVTLEGPLNITTTYLHPNTRIYLYPGNYTLNIMCVFNESYSVTRSWSFKINNGINRNIVNSTLLEELLNLNNVTKIYLDNFFVKFVITNSSLYLTNGKYDVSLLDNNDQVLFQGKLIIDNSEPWLVVNSPQKGQHGNIVYFNFTTNAVEVFYRLDNSTSYQKYELNQSLILEEGEHLLSLKAINWLSNVIELNYTFYVGLQYVNMTLYFLESTADITLPIENLTVTITNEWNNTLLEIATANNGSLTFATFPGTFNVIFNYNGQNYDFSLSTYRCLNQTIWVGTSNVTITLYDIYLKNPISRENVLIKNSIGHVVSYTQSNVNGTITLSLPMGDYYLYYVRNEVTFEIPFQVFMIEHHYDFYIPSPLSLLTLLFKYDNGSNCYNLEVFITTVSDFNITAKLINTSQLSIYCSYGPITITVILPNGKKLTYQRIFEPKSRELTIVIPTETKEQWTKIPFQITGANFAILISTSLEYFDYYLKGSLLFAYTLLYTEILLIIIVVIFNIYTIINNVFIETKREFTIMKIIGGRFVHLFASILLRFLLVGALSALVGYGFGALVLTILTLQRQTVFFGHTFSISMSWEIFFINLVTIIFGVMIISLILTLRLNKEKRIVVSTRR